MHVLCQGLNIITVFGLKHIFEYAINSYLKQNYPNIKAEKMTN